MPLKLQDEFQCGNHPHENLICRGMMQKSTRRSVTAPLCCLLMESQGANLLPSRAPLLEPVARGGGVTTYKLIPSGRSTVVFTVAPLGTSPKGVAEQHKAQCQWCIPWRLEVRALGVAATLCCSGAVSSLAWVAGDHR